MPFRGIRSSSEEWIFHSFWMDQKQDLQGTAWNSPRKYGDFLMSKQLKVDDPTYAMLAELSKKHSMNPTAVLESLVAVMYQQMKRTGRKVLWVQFQQINELTDPNEVKDVFRSRREKRERYAAVEPTGGQDFLADPPAGPNERQDHSDALQRFCGQNNATNNGLDYLHQTRWNEGNQSKTPEFTDDAKCFLKWSPLVQLRERYGLGNRTLNSRKSTHNHFRNGSDND